MQVIIGNHTTLNNEKKHTVLHFFSHTILVTRLTIYYILQGGLWTLTTVAGVAVWFLDESSYRHLWCIGSSVMATIFPYNMFIMMPDANRLLNDTVIKEQGNLITLLNC